MTQTPESAPAPDDAVQFVDAFIERAEQACRYAFKYQNGDEIDAETMAEICEKAIRPHLERHGHVDALLVRLRAAALQPSEIARADLIAKLKGLAGPRACEEAIALIAGDGERLAEQERRIVALTQERDAFQARAIAAEAEAKSERDRRHGAVAEIWRLADPDAPPSSSDEREALEALTARIAKLLKGGQSTAVEGGEK